MSKSEVLKLMFLNPVKDYVKEYYKPLILTSACWAIGFLILGKVIASLFFGLGLAILISIIRAVFIIWKTKK